MNQSLLLYSDVYEKAKRFTDYEKAYDFVDNRTKDTFLLGGIAGLGIEPNGMKIEFDVRETDEHLILNNTPITQEEFFISNYVWNHLAGFLGIPVPVFNYYQRFIELNKEDFRTCQENEAEILQILFNDRLDKKLKSSRIKDIYITVFEDGFGRFPRVIHSDIYYPYKDSRSFDVVNNGLQSANEKYQDKDYRFKNAWISPYSSEIQFSNNNTKSELVNVGDTIESGISVINSECKLASFTYQALIIRLSCLNGVTNNFKDNALRIRHYESGFEQKIKAGFVKVLKLENDFAKIYLEASEFNQPISDNWSDLLELPSSFLAMKQPEKQEIIEIAEKEEYKFSPYGIVQALTYKSSHKAFDDSTKKRINDKALHVLDNIELMQEWKPKRLEANS